jgi:O-methyltransferase domain/Dimerisation domain
VTEAVAQHSETPAPAARVTSLIMGKIASAAVSAVAKLGVPDHLESGPKTAAELAELVHVKPDLLSRLMRATEALGILAQTPEGRWAQTPMSDVLRTNSPRSLRDLAIFYADEWHSLGFGSLDETVRSGAPAMERLYRMPYFEFFRGNPEESEHFNRAMTAFSTMDAPAVVEAYDFSGIGQLTDVGGGHGLLLTTILERYPKTAATLFEQPQVIESVAGRLSSTVSDRIRLVSGDMFVSIPPGADAYIMKRIMHDWPDDLCRKILLGCRAGVRDGGKLIVVDAVVPEGSEFSPAKLMDLTMMLLGGKERTEEEFRSLFAASGWKLSRVIRTASQLSVIEGVPA